MSTSPRREPGAGPGQPHPEQPHPEQPHEELAPLLGNGFRSARAACRDEVARCPSLPYVGYISKGVYRFSADRLGAGFGDRAGLHRIGRRVAQSAEEIDHALQEPDTGPLIRTVVHTDSGAVLCNHVIPQEYVVAVATGGPQPVDGPLTDVEAVNDADITLSGLTTRLRELVSLPSLNHGGWQTAHTTRPLSSVGGVDRPRTESWAEVPERLRAGLTAAVRPQDLHYLAYHVDGEPALESDVLGHASLERFYTKVDVDERRIFYREFGWQLDSVVRKFNRMLTGALSGGLVTRLVLDVERGAIYYYQLDIGVYLVGVTLDQSRVRDADERVARLAHRAGSG
ncbi:hypothetical protein ABZ816_23790 [Actinosynnema sp. NPDC047251]|uniref:Uncharacterized protein n=1 Tax=Saccharothrix espanaensis (strain ATCC 51144 / DSM 44229 / JCM 9112 / NBRC 15066 / NRRL 15764) TaxID=1179773 RepID=K0JXA0_SACES|nr:hypothetical protein [Saccharothrix espanaensis]CCH32505.1 hypothetical protein BN6_52410 [Saccharothrix espanaensis DSM 44229]